MKKIKSIPILYLLFIFYCSVFLMIISSCNDELVNPNDPVEKLDTNSRYNWNYDFLDNFWSERIYVADSNNVYITGSPSPLYYNGTDYTPIDLHDPNFSSYSINGYNKENIFIGGAHLNNIYSIAQLFKMEAGSIVDYPLLDDSTGGINDIVVEGPDEAWLKVSEKNYVYKFNSGIFTRYELDPGTREGLLLKTQNNNLFLFSTKSISGPNYYVYIYKFENNSFRNIKIDTVCSNCESTYLLYKIQNLMMKVDRKSISYFNETNWVKICDTRLLNNDRYKLSPQWITGSSKDYLICYSEGPETPTGKGIFIWNGSKWSWEKNLSYNLPTGINFATDMIFKDNKVYLALSNSGTTPISILLKGILKF